MVDEIEKLITTHSKGLKRSETKSLVQFLGENDAFVCGYSEKPKQINFYFQPLYDHPESYSKLEKKYKTYLKGKSCLHLPKTDRESLKVVEELLKVYRAQAMRS